MGGGTGKKLVIHKSCDLYCDYYSGCVYSGIYVSQILPYFVSACRLSLGMCWKAGVAAEVIGVPKGSIGEKLYNAKIYLETPDLFAWTIVIIVISFVFEKCFLWLVRKGVYCVEHK